MKSRRVLKVRGGACAGDGEGKAGRQDSRLARAAQTSRRVAGSGRKRGPAGLLPGTARASRHASPGLHLTRKPRQPGLRLRVEAPWVSASRTHHLPFRLRMPEQLTAENGGT